MEIAIILSAVRQERKSHHLAYFLSNKEYENVSMNLVDLQEFKLPLFGVEIENKENIEHVRNILVKSDGIIFVSPEYHNTYSSALKNMTEYFWSEFAKKPIGVAATSAGKFGGIQASLHMQTLVLALGGYPIPTRLLIPEIQSVFNEDGKLLNTDLEKSIDLFLSEYLDFANILYQYKKATKQFFCKSWLKKQPK